MSTGHDRRRRRLLLALAAGTVAAAALLGWALLTGTAGETVTVDVPPGTQQRIDAGASVELLPAVLRVEVGDTLVVINRDDVAHQVGPYTVAAGQTLRQRFASPGRIEGLCTLHPSGAIAIVVE